MFDADSKNSGERVLKTGSPRHKNRSYLIKADNWFLKERKRGIFNRKIAYNKGHMYLPILIFFYVHMAHHMKKRTYH